MARHCRKTRRTGLVWLVPRIEMRALAVAMRQEVGRVRCSASRCSSSGTEWFCAAVTVRLDAGLTSQ